MKTLMILGASVLQLPAIRAAKAMGLRVIAVDMNPDAVGMGEADTALVISTIDEDAVLAAAKQHQIDGIMTLASDMPMRAVARVCEAMGLRGIDSETAIRATNKRAMREALRDAGVPIPRFCAVRNHNEYRLVISKMPGTYIVKPADNSGSRGVTKVERGIDPKAAYDHAMDHARTGEILVEEFMSGHEVSVEAVSIDGEPHIIAITDKLTTSAPYFVEMGHSEPSTLPDAAQADIRRVACAAIRAIGITDGPSHTEIMLTDEGAKVVEIGARLGGDCITSHLVPLSTGVDIVGATISIALGEAPDLVAKHQRGAAIRYFAPEPGTVTAIGGVAEAEKIDGIREITFVKQIGDALSPIRSSTDRAGFVIAQADTAESAIKTCEAALKRINIQTERAHI